MRDSEPRRGGSADATTGRSFPLTANKNCTERRVMSIKAETIETLISLAKDASQRAYCPYSGFRVGAAALAASGKIFVGCNVENASYGLTICAERNAIFSMIAHGEAEVLAIAIYTPTPSATAPCGACRQVLIEFGPDASVVCACDGAGRIDTSVSALLPHAFGSPNLKKDLSDPSRATA